MREHRQGEPGGLRRRRRYSASCARFCPHRLPAPASHPHTTTASLNGISRNPKRAKTKARLLSLSQRLVGECGARVRWRVVATSVIWQGVGPASPRGTGLPTASGCARVAARAEIVMKRLRHAWATSCEACARVSLCTVSFRATCAPRASRRTPNVTDQIMQAQTHHVGTSTKLTSSRRGLARVSSPHNLCSSPNFNALGHAFPRVLLWCALRLIVHSGLLQGIARTHNTRSVLVSSAVRVLTRGWPRCR